MTSIFVLARKNYLRRSFWYLHFQVNVNVCVQKHYLRLIVVLDAHGEDVDADDEGDEEVQVVAGAQCVDGQTQGRVVRIVRSLLGLCSTKTHTNKNRQKECNCE